MDHQFEHDAQDAQKSFQATQSAATNAYKTGIDLFEKGIQRNIELQKHAMQLISEQNAETINLWRVGAEQVFNLAQQTVEDFIGMRQRYLNVLGEQIKGMADSEKTQGERTERAAYEVTTEAA